MNSSKHEPGRLLNVQNRYFLRNERNGLTVLDRKEHLFYFYEGMFIENIAGDNGQVEIDVLQRMMSDEKLLTKNVQSDSPFSVCWLISGSCNLDCIYCFAGDKMHAEKPVSHDEMDTARHLLRLKPLCVSLSGGEPTLNPRLKDVLLFFKGKISTVLDTNGTTPQLMKLIPVLKETDTTVRLTVDILDDEILGKVRPQHAATEMRAVGGTAYSQSEMLQRNIRALTEAGVPLVIHTVLTRYNIGKLEKTAETLVRLGVRRWHFYAVNYSKKCSAFFDEIKVSLQEACEYTDRLIERFGKDIRITCPRNDIGNRERAVLLIDSRGRFCVDTVQNGSLFLGIDPCFPEKEEVLAGMDYELHKQAYLCNFWNSEFS